MRLDAMKDKPAKEKASRRSGAAAAPPDKLLTPDEVAERLSITVSQVYTLMREGDLVALKIGKRGVWRVATAELDAYVESLRQDALRRIQGQRASR